MAVSVPTGIKIFNWLATLWGGKIHFTVSDDVYRWASLFQFLIAGLTGIMLSVAPFDWQLSHSYFVVAHFHYVLVGAILFILFAAFYYWYPKMTGRMLNEKLGKWHFWIFPHRVSPDFRPDAYPRHCWACRVVFTHMKRTAAG